jgi:lipopolysaccharide export system protein LptA
MKKILIGSILLPVCFCLFAAKPTNVEKFQLVHSDKLYLSRGGEEQILELSGKVHFWYGDTEFKGDRAVIFDKQKIARLTGNVRVSNDSLRLEADSLAYYRLAEELNLGGKVKITEEKKGTSSFRWFTSGFAVYDRKNDKVTAWKNVSSYDREENAFASCGYAFWDRKTGYAYMIEDPKLRSGTTDTLYVEADKLEFFDPEQKIVATFNVDVRSKDYHVTSDILIYFLEDEKAVFTGEPLFVSDYTQAEAMEFYLGFKDRKLISAELVDSCKVFFSEERGADKTNWVTAGFISIAFQDDAIREFTAEKGVTYYYRQEKQEKKDYFVNAARGEFLEAKFNADNKLDIMRMSRGIKGTYKFHNKS